MAPKYEDARGVQMALARIKALFRQKRRHETNTRRSRDIRLGLDRIKHVVGGNQRWKGVHVAGTNGKGSICALLSGLFKLAGTPHGMFISPAFPERHNGVIINGRAANKRMYEIERGRIEATWRKYSHRWMFTPERNDYLGDTLTPFELETATAFAIFNRLKAAYGIVEVGMGGGTDATNAMKQKAVTIISKIGLDHQEYLGNSIREIALAKAGIMRPGVPCVVDDSNDRAVMRALKRHARNVGAMIYPASKLLLALKLTWADMEKLGLEEYQIRNLLCAAAAFRLLFPGKQIDLEKLLSTEPFLPGRMEQVSISEFTTGRREEPVLVDGGHNEMGIAALASHVDGQLRGDGRPVTWVMAVSASKSKPFAKLINTLLRPQDNFAFVEFSPGPNEPAAVSATFGRDHARGVLSSEDQLYDGEPTISGALHWASEKAGDGPIVVTGSLYLLKEIYELPGVHSGRVETLPPGHAQLWHYAKESQKRELTPEETREVERAVFRNSSKGAAFRRPKGTGKPSQNEEPSGPGGDAAGPAREIRSQQIKLHKAPNQDGTGLPGRNPIVYDMFHKPRKNRANAWLPEDSAMFANYREPELPPPPKRPWADSRRLTPTEKRRRTRRMQRGNKLKELRDAKERKRLKRRRLHFEAVRSAFSKVWHERSKEKKRLKARHRRRHMAQRAQKGRPPPSSG